MKRFILPKLEFIGGETQEFILRLFTQNKVPLDASHITSEFSIIPYRDYIDDPIVCKAVTAVDGDNGVPSGKVKLEANDTVGLEGKYIYQISLKDKLNNVDIYQGELMIYQNTNRSFIL